MKNSKVIIPSIILMLLSFYNSNANDINNDERPMYEIHSMMVYNFMKYIHWPPASGSGDFVIGVVGDTDVFETLVKWYGNKTKGIQKISIKFFKSETELTDCHVLYVGKAKSAIFGDVMAKLAGKPTLVVTSKAGLGEQGSLINFKTVDNKLKFELNQAAVDKANLKVATQLSGMAIVI